MKQAAKVFIWIGMVLSFFAVAPLVVGILALKKLNEAKTKDELQTLGILTLLFCSLLGGVFMLCVDDKELQQNNQEKELQQNNQEQEYNNQAEQEYNNQAEQEQSTEKYTKSRKRIKLFTQVSNWTVYGFCMLCLIFALFPVIKLEGTEFIPLILSGCMLPMSVVNAFLYNSKIKSAKLTAIILTGILTLTAIATLVLSITAQQSAYYIEYWYSSYYQDWIALYYHGAWEYWVIFGMSCAIVILLVTNLILNLVALKKPKQKVIKVKSYAQQNVAQESCAQPVYVQQQPAVKPMHKTVREMEAELLDIKRLFDNSLITEEEYQRIRTKIVAKYYQ